MGNRLEKQSATHVAGSLGGGSQRGGCLEEGSQLPDGQLQQQPADGSEDQGSTTCLGFQQGTVSQAALESESLIPPPPKTNLHIKEKQIDAKSPPPPKANLPLVPKWNAEQKMPFHGTTSKSASLKLAVEQDKQHMEMEHVETPYLQSTQRKVKEMYYPTPCCTPPPVPL